MAVKKFKQKKYLLFAGLVLVALGIAIAVLLFSLRYDHLWAWYGEARSILANLEDKIASLDKVWEFIGAILLLFLIKCFIPVYTTSTVCFLTGVVLPAYLAIPVNMLGLCIQFSVRYYWGKKYGAGKAWNYLLKNEWIKDLMDSGGIKNDALLAALRLIPGVPVNGLSGAYGSYGFDFGRFLIISMIGYFPRLVSFTFVGRNMFDPLSSAFLVPIMVICFFTGVSCLSVNGVWNAIEKAMESFNIRKAKKERKRKNKEKKGMLKNSELRKNIEAGIYDDKLAVLYKASDIEEQKARYIRVSNEFDEIYGGDREVEVFSAPGRSEIGGNHTDHNHGKVLAAGVDLDAIAVASKNDDNTVRIKSEGYGMDTVVLGEYDTVDSETGHSASLVRGVCAAFAKRGYNVGGFDAATASDVISGSGLSSSAAFEVLVGTMLNYLFNDGKISAVEIAQIAQYAENVYFGKPCGLMDQTACSVGGFVKIDFKDPSAPVIDKVDFDFASCGHSLCIIDSGADHSDLTDEYAAVRGEMEKAASVFGMEVLRDVDRKAFEENIPAVRKIAGDRAVLRAKHFFNENERVDKQSAALEEGDFEAFKALIIESGFSSYMYNQNVFACSAPQSQAVSVALAVCHDMLKDKGAWRVHGGGFAGTIQAFVPNDILSEFKEKITSIFGEKSCYVLNIRPVGGTKVI